MDDPAKDLAKSSRGQIRIRVHGYLGPDAAPEVIDAATDMAQRLFSLEDLQQRHAAMSALSEFFCPHCGSGYLPCYCWNDE